MIHINIPKAGTDHKIWIKGFSFYRDELDIMESRLSEIADKNTAFDIRQDIEHFQNQFIVQRNNIDELKHEVNLYVQQFEKYQSAFMNQEEKQFALHEKYEDFERVMNLLRHEFNEFLSKKL